MTTRFSSPSHNLLRRMLIAGAALMLLGSISPAKAGTEKTFYSFKNDGVDGTGPQGPLISGASGYFLGTTFAGGSDSRGTVYMVNTKGVEVVLHTFTGNGVGGDGYFPSSGLTPIAGSDFYGTTPGGGDFGYGTIYSITQAGTYGIVYSFTGNADGCNPYAGLVKDAAGNLYGTTFYGGASGNMSAGFGTVYKFAPGGAQTVLYSFTGGNDGGNPRAGVVLDHAGDIYGVATNDGQFKLGTLFKLTPGGVFSVLHVFTGGSDGSNPIGGLTIDGRNLYGTTNTGGTSNLGTVFKLALGAKPTFTTLHSFTGGGDAYLPTTELIYDQSGNLFGTTGLGGSQDAGAIYMVAPDGTESVLYSFSPVGGLQAGPAGALLLKGSSLKASGITLYGTINAGGVNNRGAVFKFKP